MLITVFAESEPHPDVSSNPRISIVPLPPHPAVLQTSNKLLFLLVGPLKVLFQIACLWQGLAYRTKPAKWLLVQVSQDVNRPVGTARTLLSLSISPRTLPLSPHWQSPPSSASFGIQT